MSREIRIKQKYLREQNKRYSQVMAAVAKTDWPPSVLALETLPFMVFRSCHHLAQIFDEPDGVIRISVIRTMIDDAGMWLQGVSWDDLQRIKAECGFRDSWAVEVFPPHSALVNVAAIRHLWVLRGAPAFAWNKAKAEGAA